MPRNAVTTNTFLTTQQYDIFGTSSGPAGVPEPATWGLMLAGIGAIAAIKTKRFLPCVLFAGVAVHASPITGLPACTSALQTNCAAATTGGSTLISTGAFPNQTTVFGVLTGGQTIFDQFFATAPTDPSVSAAVAQDQARLAQFAPHDPLPACTSTLLSYCVASNPGGAIVVTNSTTSAFVNVDTPVSQRVDQYQTTLLATLNGTQTVYQQTFALPFSDPAVQAALTQANAILTADKATFGTPVQVSNSSTLQSSQVSFVQTGPPSIDGNQTSVTSATFGPAIILTGDNQTTPFFVLAGQNDINILTNNEYTVPRNAVTTNTFLTTQQYDIFGTSSGPAGVPEPATWGLMLAGIGAIAAIKTKRFLPCLLFAGVAAHASPITGLPACTSAFQTNCAACPTDPGAFRRALPLLTSECYPANRPHGESLNHTPG